MKHWYTLHRLVMQSLSLEFFKTRLDEALCNLICPQSWSCFEQQFALQTSDVSSSLNYPTILWLNDVALCLAVPYPQDLLWVTWKNDTHSDCSCLESATLLHHTTVCDSAANFKQLTYRETSTKSQRSWLPGTALTLTSRINFNTSIGSTFPTHSFVLYSAQYGHMDFFGKSWQHSV